MKKSPLEKTLGAPLLGLPTYLPTYRMPSAILTILVYTQLKLELESWRVNLDLSYTTISDLSFTSLKRLIFTMLALKPSSNITACPNNLTKEAPTMELTFINP